jgi:hypothetical protein
VVLPFRDHVQHSHFSCGRGQAYEQNYGRGQGYGQNFGRGHGYRKKFGRGQDNKQIEYIVNPQKEISQTDMKSENVGRGRGRARPLIIKSHQKITTTLNL